MRRSFVKAILRTLGFVAALGSTGVAALACGGESSDVDGGSTDGGNSSRCPSAVPASGAACTSHGLQCTYDCSILATCVGVTWSIAASKVPCKGTEAGPPKDAGRLPDGAFTCTSNSDCPSVLQCSPGGAPTGCGICEMPQYPCNTSSDCALLNDAAPPTPMVCGPLGPCTCAPPGRTGQCIPACEAKTGCGADETCADSGLCVPKACTSDTECASTQYVDYACGSAGVCAPKTCTTDADCSGHYCVSGTCYPEQGVCVGPAA
jgi:hypothetical protein